MRFLLFALCLSLLLFGCDSGDDLESAAPGFLPETASYTWSLERRSVATDSLEFRETATVEQRVLSRDAAVPGYGGLVELETRVEAEAGPSRSRTWYDASDERLLDVAYASPNGYSIQPRGTPFVAADALSLPRTVAELFAQHAGEGIGRSANDSTTVRDDLRVVYELPLTEGDGWVSFTEPFRSTREVIGRETVTVEAGTFDCFVLDTEVSFANESTLKWRDYVSPEHGLVLRTITTVGEDRNENNEVLGFVRYTERVERTG